MHGDGDGDGAVQEWVEGCAVAMDDVKLTSRHFILVTWNHKLRNQLLVLCYRLLCRWRLPPRIVVSRCIRSQEVGGGGDGGSAAAGDGSVNAADDDSASIDAACAGADVIAAGETESGVPDPILDEALLLRDALSDSLNNMFRADYVASFVAGITDEELLDSFDIAWWAHEAVETWFEDGDMEAPLHGLLNEGEADAVRAHYSALGRSLTNFQVAQVVLEEHLDEMVVGLPAKVTGAVEGTLIKCETAVGDTRTVRVRVHKARDADSSDDIEHDVRHVCLDGDGSAKLWFHGARSQRFRDVAIGECVSSPNFYDFGPGFYLVDTLQCARAFLCGKNKVVAVYRDPSEGRGAGTRFGGATDLWKEVAGVGCMYGRTSADFKSALTSSGHKDMIGSRWIEGPIVKSHISVRRGTKTVEPLLKENAKEMEVQVVVREQAEANIWYAGLVAIIVFGCPSPAVDADAQGEGASAGAGAGVGAGAGAGAGERLSESAVRCSKQAPC